MTSPEPNVLHRDARRTIHRDQYSEPALYTNCRKGFPSPLNFFLYFLTAAIFTSPGSAVGRNGPRSKRWRGLIEASGRVSFSHDSIISEESMQLVTFRIQGHRKIHGSNWISWRCPVRRPVPRRQMPALSGSRLESL